VARSGNGLEDLQSGSVGQGFRDLFDLGSIHKRTFTLAGPKAADSAPSGAILTPIEIRCNRIVRRSSKYRNFKGAAKGPGLEALDFEKDSIGRPS
jgi:hypothetical protein